MGSEKEREWIDQYFDSNSFYEKKLFTLFFRLFYRHNFRFADMLDEVSFDKSFQESLTCLFHCW